MSSNRSHSENRSNEKQTLGASFRDPSGFLFEEDKTLYRQVNLSYKNNYDQLIQSGLYERLINSNLLIPHQEVQIDPFNFDDCYKILEPRKLDFISYPYEWCFSQLKDAALTTLKVQKIALEFGMSLKDSSAYNIQFFRGYPLLIDTLSFEIYQQGKPWVAYRQFCQHFLAPLSLMSYKDIRLSQLLRVYIDGIPLDLTSKLLPWQTRLNFSLLLHIHLHAASQKRFAEKEINATGNVRRESLLGLLDNLESGIRKLQWKHKKTEWENYYEATNYTLIAFESKKTWVKEFLDQIRPLNVWDLGSNTSEFSQISSTCNIPTIAFDFDPGAVEKAYKDSLLRNDLNLLPLTIDLSNPSPAIGWQLNERMSLVERGPADVILVLALIHHLAISNNVPLDLLAKFFHKLGNWLIIEFIPKDDTQVQRLLSTREDIFPGYTVEVFESVFSSLFDIVRREEIEGSNRILYLMKGN